MAEETENPQQEPRKIDKLDRDLFWFLIKIMRTIFVGFFWMFFNVFLGLFLGFAVPEESTPGRMIFFYSWFVLSLAGYLYMIWRFWRKKMDRPD
ncbi:hypothetical protein HF324_24965 [Chitinophaga oryzae]|uniref:Uncharacterized protein n=1 Tax=Chitinophaga oryzae TaxID=2725414 RepID=A0AAE7D9G3_9BACT|nr:hypothetical protein [Chitinophaga oryzae]QJB34398.1 hypothetical protein HF329_25110 [Chitinophaga oryzae]QJB40915.1 hypothetical protein HF324_24965 [Chitinophaga oryzae]